ncbi:GntP family permease [Pseudonocardia sp. RS11V-5]|uniref:GntT/GntP/DsdX family permease n=1 Tax=Pseudonocardia terrae TaxID=2905831 RepID=UPI001E5B2991|nr:SLC13 family permease [Pseudonocardia terrae]MCE3553346.1 GntP family permease [Pseudonocardia terrae]
MTPLAVVLAQAKETAPAAGATQLVVATLLGIAVIVLLITWLHVHPFLALIAGTAVLGIVGGLGPDKTITSFTNGVGSTVGSVGVLIALGAMIGGLLRDSGGADRVVEAVTRRVGPRGMPWALAGLAALVGIPLFFEIGVVLLVPVVVLVAARTRSSVIRIGIPALAGLSVLHGLVPPHPGPLVAISALKADLGLTLLFGLIIAVPTVIIAGPLFGRLASRWVPLSPPSEREAAAVAGRAGGTGDDGEPAGPPEPSGPSGSSGAARVAAAERTGRQVRVSAAVAVMLTPVVLMLLRAIAEVTLADGNPVRSALDVIGEPIVALLVGVVVAMFALGLPSGMSRRGLTDSVGGALPAIAGILLIVAAGGGFKQALVDAGVGTLIGQWAGAAALSPLILGWLVAVAIRVATGSATVATITAAGIVAPLAAGLSPATVALLALAVGAGSLFFSHVNDAGFWLVKEYFGLTVGQTIKSWSVMETIISVVGLLLVLLVSVFV